MFVSWELQYVMLLGAAELSMMNLVLTLCCTCARYVMSENVYLGFPYFLRDLVRLQYHERPGMYQEEDYRCYIYEYIYIYI